MVNGWRGFVQAVLLRMADATGDKPSRRWTPEAQKVAVAVGLTFAVSLIVALGAFISLSDAMAPKFPWRDAACIQAMWQGRWALSALTISTLTFLAVVVGFQQNRLQQRREFRAYVLVDLQDLMMELGQPIEFKAKLVNYGRTVAKGVVISFDWFVAPPNWKWDRAEYPLDTDVASFNMHPQGRYETDTKLSVLVSHSMMTRLASIPLPCI